MAQITTNLGLFVWDNPADYYNHENLAANWFTIDSRLLDKTGDTATGTITRQVDSSSVEAFSVKFAGDTEARLKTTSNSISFGTGSAVQDVGIERISTSAAELKGSFTLLGSNGNPTLISSENNTIALRGKKTSTQAFIDNRVGADTQSLFSIRGDGRISWGPGGSNPPDTLLYRTSSGKVKIESDLEAANITATSSLVVDGQTIAVSGGGFTSSTPFSTSSTITARNGHTGRVRLGNVSDNTRAEITFGSGSDINLYRDASQSPVRLRTDNRFESNSIKTGQIESGNIITTGSIQASSGITITGNSTFNNTLTVSGTLTGQGGSFNSLDVRSGAINASSSANIYFSKPIIAQGVSSNQNLYVAGTSTLTGAVAAAGRITAHQGITVNNTSSFSNTVTFSAGGVHFNTTPYFNTVLYAGEIRIQHVRFNNSEVGYVTFPPMRMAAPSGSRFFDMNGGLILNNNNSANSDAALKKDFESIDDSSILEAIKRLDVRSWKWNELSPIQDEYRHVGPTLQEFEEKFGGVGVIEYVEPNGNTGKVLNLLDMIGILYKSVNILAKEVDRLKS
jgi:cytoskeletal protein CcmA (bactofilin family)